MNHLEEWAIAMKLFKFKHVITDPTFDASAINRIVGAIHKFFPEETYTVNLQSRIASSSNWLLDFLLIKDPARIGFAVELSQVIEYYYSLVATDRLSPFSQNMGMDEIRNRLSELLINLFLTTNGLETQLNDVYVIQDSARDTSVEKPLDASFTFNNQKYIVECKKIYNSKLTALSETWQKMIRDILQGKHNTVKKINVNWLPSGYLIIDEKADLELASRQLKNDFKDCYDQFIDGEKEHTGFSPFIITRKTANYEIYIITAINTTLRELEDAIAPYRYAILFHSKFDISNPLNTDSYGNVLSANSILHFEVPYSFTEEEVTSRLRKIIEKAIGQHSKNPDHKLVFLEFEQVSFIFGKMAQSIDIDQINAERIKSLLKKDVSIILWSRNHREAKRFYAFRLFPSPSMDEVIRKKLSSFQPIPY